MTVGFIMLCHTALHRAEQVARHWAVQGCPVVIHVDRSVSQAGYARMVENLAPFENVRFCARYRCEWGTFSLVEAMQAASAMILREFPKVRHVYAASGSCMPLRPVEELRAYLQERPHTDFIESVTTADVAWTAGGISYERFVLRFPFSWRRQRWLFDRWVDLQRLFAMRRKLPEGIVPHLGSQWWCLTRQTLSAILQDPRRRIYDDYFRYVWIPDESYFQTLARLYSNDIESRSLTLSKFDFQGKPHVFYDDHLQLLRRSDCFVARKIWPRADKLYRHFLLRETGTRPRAEPNPGKIDRLFAKAIEQRTRGRAGLYMQSRFPNPGWENGRTAAPYSVFEGFSELFEDFETWLGKMAGSRVHGHLYAPDRVEFAGGDPVFNGALSASPALRDHNPNAFLTNLTWNTRGERQCFQFGPRDNQEISWLIAGDPNAQVSVITGAWALPLFRANIDFGEKRRAAARLQQIETEHVQVLRSPHVKARVRIWSLADFVAAPMEPLQQVLDEITPRALHRPIVAPRMVDLSGFGQFLQNLRNQGMQPTLMGEFPLNDEPFPALPVRRRPYLVK
ncbi:beta-1,6-N-acetylglucosaminyltransferase [Alkalilacustris brevis]|uniref:DUF5927 domain-containing protein n=1 Tax=Alkalilacustris brevis TaxID=2026338 RepID=UPI000E0D025D|nr:beta-1,6-N-acetylglucosaminyltransferase [Alkalilacustris brevis]